MKILVTMGRRYGYKKCPLDEVWIRDEEAIDTFFVTMEEYLWDITDREINLQSIIHGCAPGEDMLVARFCSKWRHISEERYPADWETYGKSAGPKRNLDMLFRGKPDLVVAFPGGSGTEHMITQARKNNVPVRIVE